MHPEGAHAKCGVLRTHTGEVCSDHLGTLYSGCSRESSRGQLTQVRLWPLDVCVECARDGPGGAQRKCVRVRGERVPSTRPTMTVAGGFGEMQTSCNGDPLVDGRGGLGRMRGSMDVVDAEWLQGNEVAIVGLKKDVLFSESTNIILYRESVSLT
jgi:hypothetical protein